MRLERHTPWVGAPCPLTDALRLAVEDVARDWRAVFGRSPTLTAAPRVDGPALVIGREALAALELEARPLQHEQHAIEVVHVHGHEVLAVYGGDDRGDIYALYEFSRLVLGIDPMWYWTDRVPIPRGQIELEAAFCFLSASPSFRYRGWFINDEDLLTGWAPDPLDETGISLGVWNRIYESLLRCKGNTVIPGTFVFPDEPQVRLAGRRGIVLAQHHATPLGLNTYCWPDDQPYSYASHPETLERAWRKAVEQHGTSEVLWSVGYRGQEDRPFWLDDQAAGRSASERGALISRAVARQLEIVRRQRPADRFVFYMWGEGEALWRAGHLHIPADVIVAWPDDDHGHFLHPEQMRPGDGGYYHTAMHDGVASQLSEMVPLPEIDRAIRRLAAAGATEHLMVNVSDIRPRVMTAATVMDLCWQLPDEGLDGRSYRLWARDQFGDALADHVGGLWEMYFEAAWRYSPREPYKLEDAAYHSFSKVLLMAMVNGELEQEVRRMMPLDIPAGDPEDALEFAELIWHIPGLLHATVSEMARRLVDGTARAQGRWDALWRDASELSPRIPEERREFFHGHLVTQVAIHALSNRLLGLVAGAALLQEDGEPDLLDARLAEAASTVEEIFDVERAAEYGKWRGWYRGERFVSIATTGELIRDARARLELGDLPSEDRLSWSWPPDYLPYLRRQGRFVEVD